MTGFIRTILAWAIVGVALAAVGGMTLTPTPAASDPMKAHPVFPPPFTRFYKPETIPQEAKDKVSHYFLKEFKPKYRRAECLVQFDFTYSGPTDISYSSLIFHDFSYYLVTKEPNAALFSFQTNGRDTALFIQFPDQCDRRFEIADALAAFLVAKHPEFEMTARHEPIEPGPDTMDGGSAAFWIDGLK